MSNYNTINNFLSGLELNDSVDSKDTNNKKKNKKLTTALDRMEDSQKEFNKNKEFTNNFMCFRDMNFKNNLESQQLDLSNNFSEPLESEENLTQRKQKSGFNDKLSDRNNLFSNRKNAPIMDNQPIFSRSTDD